MNANISSEISTIKQLMNKDSSNQGQLSAEEVEISNK